MLHAPAPGEITIRQPQVPAGPDASHSGDFARVFRRIYGASPTDYRYEVLR